jgi:hypothetical protein
VNVAVSLSVLQVEILSVKVKLTVVNTLAASTHVVLLTSYRDFDNDREWEWLHNDSLYASALVFEPTGDGGGNKAEMVVTNEWKSKVSFIRGLRSHLRQRD